MARCAEAGCAFYASRHGYCSVCYRRHFGQDPSIQDSDPDLPPGWIVLSTGRCGSDQGDFFGFPQCVVVLKYQMDVHMLRGDAVVYTCVGEHFHRPPVVCVGDQVICGNNDGRLSSINLATGSVQRSQQFFPHGWPPEHTWRMDSSARFIRIDTIHRVVNPMTLELMEEADAMELPVCKIEDALPNDLVPGDAAEIPGLAPHTNHGSSRSWSRQLFHTDFGLVVTSLDNRTKDYKIHCRQASVVLTLHTSVIDEGLSVICTNLAGETIFAQVVCREDEFTMDLWTQIARQAGAPGALLQLVLSDGRIISRDSLMQGLTFASLR